MHNQPLLPDNFSTASRMDLGSLEGKAQELAVIGSGDSVLDGGDRQFQAVFEEMADARQHPVARAAVVHHNDEVVRVAGKPMAPPFRFFIQRIEHDVVQLSGSTSLGCHIFAKQLILFKRQQALFSLTILLVVTDALQDFQKYEVADSDSPLDYRGIQKISMRVSGPVSDLAPRLLFWFRNQRL